MQSRLDFGEHNFGDDEEPQPGKNKSPATSVQTMERPEMNSDIDDPTRNADTNVSPDTGPNGGADQPTTGAPGPVDLRDIPLWPHQEEAVRFADCRPATMLAMEMGLGKTRCAIRLMEYCENILVLAPTSVVDHVWPRELSLLAPNFHQAILGQEKRRSVREKLAEAQRIQAQARADGAPFIIVVNYESAWRDPLGRWLLNQRWDLVVHDESHRLKSPAGKLVNWAARLTSRASRRLALTGTPMPNNPLEIFGQYRALDPGVFGSNYLQFENRYAVKEEIKLKVPIQLKNGNLKETVDLIRDYRNLGELDQKFRSIAHVARVIDHLELPESREPIELGVTLSPKARRLYQTLDQELKVQIGRGQVSAKNTLTRLLRLQQLTGGHLTPDPGADATGPSSQYEIIDTAKAQAMADYLDGIDPAEPVVIFARFIADLDRIAEQAIRAGRNAYELSGRRRQLAGWQKDPGGAVLGAQLQAGGLGIDLTKARYCLYYSLGYSLGDYLQSKARLHRPGQTRPVHYHHLVAQGTVDEEVARALTNKEDVVQAVLVGRLTKNQKRNEEILRMFEPREDDEDEAEKGKLVLAQRHAREHEPWTRMPDDGAPW